MEMAALFISVIPCFTGAQDVIELQTDFCYYEAELEVMQTFFPSKLLS